MRYYRTQYPIAPGSYPKHVGNRVMAILNYRSKTYCKDFGHEVWGHIDYELYPSPKEVKIVKFVSTNNWGAKSTRIAIENFGNTKSLETGPLDTAPTVNAIHGMGGNN